MSRPLHSVSCAPLALLLVVSLCVYANTSRAAQWVGTITVRVEGSGRADPRHDKQPEETRILSDEDHRKLTDVVHIEACITDGNVAVGKVKRNLLESTDKKFDRQSHHTWCKDGKKSVKKSPGARFAHMESERIKIYTGPGATDLRKATQVSLGPIGDVDTSQLERLQDNPQALMKELQRFTEGLGQGRYQMTVNSWALIDHQSDQTDISTEVCENKTKSDSVHWRTSAPGQPEKTSQSSQGDNSAFTIYAPPNGRGLAAAWELMVDPEGFAGSTVVDESKPAFPGGYAEKTSAQWDFRPAAPCDRVKNAIQHDLAYAEAYAASGPRRQSTASYTCYVDRDAYSIMHNGAPAPFTCDQPQTQGGDSGGAEVEIGVDEDCVLQHKQDFLDKMAGQCAPEGQVDGVLAHEDVHVKQCQHDRERWKAPDNDYWGDTEVRAHLAGVRVMLDWMKDNCPDDTRALEQRMQRIESTWRGTR